MLLNVTSFKVTRDEFGDIILPCRPTSPDINMTLTKNSLLVSDYNLSIIVFKHIEKIEINRIRKPKICY